MDRNSTGLLNYSDDQNFRQVGIPEWSRSLQLVFMIVLFIFGLIGNGVIAIIQTRLFDKSSTDYLVLAMALLDFFCSTCVTPFYMAQNIRSVWSVVFSGIFCKVKYFIVYGTNISSTMLFSALAFDRYMRTCHPFSSIYTCTKSKAASLIIILISFTMALSSFYVFDENEALNDCVKVEGSRIMETVMNSCLTGAFILLFGMVVFCYTRIALKIRMRRKEHSKQKEQSLEESRTKRFKFSVLKSNKIAPISTSSDETRSYEKGRVFQLEAASSKTLDRDASGACSSDSAIDTLKTRNGIAAFSQRENHKNRIILDKMVLTASALNNSMSKRSKQTLVLPNLCFDPKVELSKESVACSKLKCKSDSVRYFRKSCQQPLDFHLKQQKIHQNLLQLKNLKLKHSTQRELKQTEDNICVESEREKKEIRKVNYVTFMMFTITATYVLTWVNAWVMYAIFDQTTNTGRVILYLVRTSFAANYIANPIFFTFMSAKFRERAKILICLRT